MTDDDVTTLFHDAPTPDLALDPEAVLAGGQRRRRRRATVAGSVVAALVAVVVGLVVGLPRTGTPTTLPAERTETSVPPDPTPELPEGVVATGGLGRPFPFTDSQDRPIPGPSLFEVDLLSTPGDDLVWYAVDDDHRRTEVTRMPSGRTVGQDGEGAVWTIAPNAPQVLLGAMPLRARSWLVVGPDGGGARQGESVLLTEGRLQPFLVSLDSAAAAESVTGVVWLHNDGGVHDDRGVIPAAHPTTRVTVWVDERLGLWGTFGESGVEAVPLPDPAAPSGLTLAGGEGSPSTVLALVPEGATDPGATFAPDCYDTLEPTITPVDGTSWAVLHARCTRHADDGTGISELSVAVDGERVPIP